MVSSSDIEIISNAAIDANGDGDRYTQIMKHLGDKKLLIVAKTVMDFETTIKNTIAIILFILGNCFMADHLCTWLAAPHRSQPRNLPTLQQPRPSFLCASAHYHG